MMREWWKRIFKPIHRLICGTCLRLEIGWHLCSAWIGKCSRQWIHAQLCSLLRDNWRWHFCHHLTGSSCASFPSWCSKPEKLDWKVLTYFGMGNDQNIPSLYWISKFWCDHHYSDSCAWFCSMRCLRVRLSFHHGTEPQRVKLHNQAKIAKL